MKKYIWTLLAVGILYTTSWAQINTFNQGQLHALPTENNIDQSMPRTAGILSYVNTTNIELLGFGHGAPLNLTALSYFPSDMVSQYAGDTINTIRIFIIPFLPGGLGKTEFVKIGIWTDTTDACAHPIYEQEVKLFSDGLNDIELDTPYVLGNTSLFIGYQVIGKGYIMVAERNHINLTEDGYGDILIEPNGHVIHAGDLGFGDLFITALVGTPDPIDAALVAAQPTPYASIGHTPVSGELKNKGADIIHSYDIRYKIDGGEPSAIYSVTDTAILSGGSMVFTHSDSAYFTTTGQHTIEVEISNVNGGGEIALDDNSMTIEVEVFDEIYQRNIVYEEGTSTGCGWCPRGIVALNTMAHDITDGTWIGISTYMSGPLSAPGYFNALGLWGTPTGRFNRVDTEDAGLETLKSVYEQSKTMPSKSKIDITAQTWDETTRQFTVEAAVNFCTDMDSVDYNLALIVVEDSIRGSSPAYAQSNYYSGNVDLIDWDGTNWRYLPNPVPAEQMCYNHIARQLIGGFDGVSGIIPSTVNYGTTYKHTFSGYIPETHNPLFTNYVALIIDNTDGHIVNAAQVHSETEVGITEEENLHGIRLYPNPSTGMLTIDNIPKRAEIHVYNVLGNMVYQQQYNNVIKRTLIDLSDLPTGNYIVNIIGKDKVFSQKIVLTK